MKLLYAAASESNESIFDVPATGPSGSEGVSPPPALGLAPIVKV
jgi:hypothetical protein